MQFKKKDHFDARCEIYFEKPLSKLFVVEIILEQAHLLKKCSRCQIFCYICIEHVHARIQRHI